MSHITHPLNETDSDSLSPWWIRWILIVMIIGFAGLITVTMLSYKNAPPIPHQIVDPQGTVVFSSEDISNGQTIFLKYGLMDNGSIWGHGAYLGPDYSADTLHRMGIDTANAIAQQQYQRPLLALNAAQQAGVWAQTAVDLKTNRYDPTTDTLHFTAPEVFAFQQQIAYWTDYFRHPERNGGLKPNLITDPTELRQFSAFVMWAAWASVANRPNENYSYTNNFPYDPQVGNVATTDAMLWSMLSLIVLLGGISAILLAIGRFDYLGWTSHGQDRKSVV